MANTLARARHNTHVWKAERDRLVTELTELTDRADANGQTTITVDELRTVLRPNG